MPMNTAVFTSDDGYAAYSISYTTANGTGVMRIFFGDDDSGDSADHDAIVAAMRDAIPGGTYAHEVISTAAYREDVALNELT